MFLKKYEELLDFNYVLSEAEKLGLSEFEEKNRCLTLNLFGSNGMIGDDRERLEYIVHSEAYGTLENSVNNKLKKFGGGTMAKMKFLLSRIFPPVYNSYSLYPFLIIYRIMKALTLRWRETLQEIKILLHSKL